MARSKVPSVNIFDYFNDELGIIPYDITQFTADQLRIAHSYWTSCHNFSSSQLARIQYKLKELKHSREIQFKEIFLRNKVARQSNDVARYNAQLDRRVVSYDGRLVKLEQHETIWTSLVKQCDYNKSLCSRDQSYREVELRTYHERGGQGR